MKFAPPIRMAEIAGTVRIPAGPEDVSGVINALTNATIEQCSRTIVELIALGAG